MLGVTVNKPCLVPFKTKIGVAFGEARSSEGNGSAEPKSSFLFEEARSASEVQDSAQANLNLQWPEQFLLANKNRHCA